MMSPTAPKNGTLRGHQQADEARLCKQSLSPPSLLHAYRGFALPWKRGEKKPREVLNEKFDFFGKLLLLAPNYPACVKPAGRSSGFERRKLFTLYLTALGGLL